VRSALCCVAVPCCMFVVVVDGRIVDMSRILVTLEDNEDLDVARRRRPAAPTVSFSHLACVCLLHGVHFPTFTHLLFSLVNAAACEIGVPRH
jgi:hypothetical protein